ncbi:hypothetical protein RZS08_38725, partial [Arthrospira platensis SPKY1]|nr:hypothetical protein [Arthrospira platensis SPKY1]
SADGGGCGGGAGGDGAEHAGDGAGGAGGRDGGHGSDEEGTVLAELTRQYRVVTERSLNLRVAGDGSAPIGASLRPHVLVHVVGPVNAAGYGEGHVFGWLGKDGQT